MNTTTKKPWHKLQALTVENRAPDEADARHLLHRAGGDHTKQQHVVHWVILHLSDEMPIHSTAYHLQIGHETIPHYFEHGAAIAFRAHDAADLQAFYNQPIRFVSDHGEQFATGATFPDLSRQLTRQVGSFWQKRYA